MSILLLAPLALAQEPATVAEQGGRFGIGIQAAYPASGISGLYQVNDKVTAQAVLGGGFGYTTLSGRLWYRFNQTGTYDIYGFGTLGYWSYRGGSGSIAIGGGSGVEVSWRELLELEDCPPIFSNFE
ncbi:MAG: hypothetical protein AAFN13_08870, partial [Bacteroidota bacterium]